MLGSRGMVVLGAVVLAGLAFFVLMHGGGAADVDNVDAVRGAVGNGSYAPRGVQAEQPPGPVSRELPPYNAPALDDIDAKSRAKMRELLRQAGEE